MFRDGFFPPFCLFLFFFPFNWMHWPGPRNKKRDSLFWCYADVMTNDSHLEPKRWHQTWSVIFVAHQYFYFYILAPAASLSGVKGRWATRIFVVAITQERILYFSVFNFETRKGWCILRESWANLNLTQNVNLCCLLMHDCSSSISLGNKHPRLWRLWI